MRTVAPPIVCSSTPGRRPVTADRGVTRYTARDELQTVVDPAGNVWEYDYDLLGRKVTTHDPDSGTTTSSTTTPVRC